MIFLINLVLASSSLYRKQMLERLELDFISISPDIDESAGPDEAPLAYVRRLSEAKAKACESRFKDALIIASDQVLLTQDGKIQGKPGTHDIAVEQLRRVRGTQATLLTGLALLNTRSGRMQSDVITYKVGYRNYTDTEIENYLQREKPYQCAGSLKSEGLGTALLTQLSGDDPTAVIGLPLIRLTQMLLDEGYPVLS